jgi:CxxC-x17-CxxC domain-containing protein
MFQDKTIVCKDCGQEFTFTASEQEFFSEKGFTNEPQRCKSCRGARKDNARGGNDGGRQMYDAVCSQCGKRCKVPFQPTGDRPIYCSDCFRR